MLFKMCSDVTFRITIIYIIIIIDIFPLMLVNIVFKYIIIKNKLETFTCHI